MFIFLLTLLTSASAQVEPEFQSSIPALNDVNLRSIEFEWQITELCFKKSRKQLADEFAIQASAYEEMEAHVTRLMATDLPVWTIGDHNVDRRDIRLIRRKYEMRNELSYMPWRNHFAQEASAIRSLERSASRAVKDELEEKQLITFARTQCEINYTYLIADLSNFVTATDTIRSIDLQDMLVKRGDW